MTTDETKRQEAHSGTLEDFSGNPTPESEEGREKALKTDNGNFPEQGADTSAEKKPWNIMEMEGLDNLHKGLPAVFVTMTKGEAYAVRNIDETSEAVSMGDALRAWELIEHLDQRPTSSALILTFENEELETGLKRQNVTYIKADLGDIETRCAYDREGLKADLQKVKETITRPDSVSLYMMNGLQKDIDQMAEEFRNVKKTGFKRLDEASGGLFSGFYVLAAVSGLGKTTFALQIADNLAEAGHDVIFYSLEQSRFELVSKSIARLAYVANGSSATSLNVRCGLETEGIRYARQQYTKKIADRLNIVEGNFDTTLQTISNDVKKYVARNQRRPVVILDYLQILKASENPKENIRAEINQVITGLKQLSRNYNIPVLAVCSMNRDNYVTPVSFEGLKESGNIEYTADVVWGLQLRCLKEDNLFKANEKTVAKREEIEEQSRNIPRELHLVCLKNRYGKKYTISLDYRPDRDYFYEVEDAKDW